MNSQQIEKYQSSSVRATSIVKAFESDEMSFQVAKKVYGEENIRPLIDAEIINMVSLLNAGMDKSEIKYFADHLFDNYSYFKISDITAFTNMIMMNWESYAKPELRDLIYWLKKYDIKRDETAETIRQKENSKYKENDFDMKKVYDRLKKEAREPKVSQKQKDAEMQKEYEKKLDEFMKKYK